MAERGSHRRLRGVLAWLMTAALVGSYYLIDAAEEDTSPAPQAAAVANPEEEGKLEIIEIKPADPTPGSAVILRVIGAQADAGAVRAFLSGKQEIEVLHRKGDQVVVRIPVDAKTIPNKVRVKQGDDPEDETRSKPYDIRIKPLNRRKVFRDVVGGLALLVFGLGMMSSGSRTYTGHRSQGVLARIGRRTSAAVGLGVLVGGVTQFTTSAAGLVVGLMGSHLLAVGPAVAVLLGAQLGAAALPAVFTLASVGASGLLVVAAGCTWLLLADDRRSKALAKIILGCGLLFYGLYLLREGFQPIVAIPELLPLIHRLDASTFTGLATCVLAGALLAALLQGPAPVFVLVLGLAQTSGRLDLQSALAILAGTGLGTAVGTSVVAWPFGSAPRRMAQYHFLLAMLGTLLLAATLDVWAFMAERLITGEADTVAYGKKVLKPNMGRHLVLAFALSQGVVTVLLAAALPIVLRLGLRLQPTERMTPPPLDGDSGVKALREGLERVIALHRGALQAILELCLTGHRTHGVSSEHALADARAQLEDLFAGAVRARSTDDPDLARLRQAALATLQLQRAMEDLLRHAERTTERAMALSPPAGGWQLSTGEVTTLRSLHQLLIEGLDAVASQVWGAPLPDADEARSREIRLNAMEMESRQGLLADRGEDPRTIARRLGSTDLVNAYESVGNHLYRLHEALASEIEQDAA